MIAFAGADVFAGIAGVLIGPLTYANPYLGNTYGISGFVALMIGGAERPVGAMVGGLLLGVLTEAANTLHRPAGRRLVPVRGRRLRPPADAAGPVLDRRRSCVARA